MMVVTTRSGKSTHDPTLFADDGDLWTFYNHPERWQQTFYTNFVVSHQEEGEIIGNEESTAADSSIDLGGTEDEGTDNSQSDSADDKAQNENLDPSIEKEKYTCTCIHCGERGHNRISCKNLHLPPECTRCGEKWHSRKTCRTENPGPTIDQRKNLCTYCGKKGHGRQACQELHLLPKCVCSKCGEKGHSQKQCAQRNSSPLRNSNDDKPTCSYCDEYGHYRNLCPNSHLPPKYVCPKCGELGHSRKGCPRAGEPRKYAYVCRHCGEDGHAVNNCPQVVREKAPGRCSYCKGTGHRRTICPSRPCRYCQATDHRPSSCPIYKAKRNRQIAQAKKRRELKKESAKRN